MRFFSLVWFGCSYKFYCKKVGSRYELYRYIDIFESWAYCGCFKAFYDSVSYAYSNWGGSFCDVVYE